MNWKKVMIQNEAMEIVYECVCVCLVCGVF